MAQLTFKTSTYESRFVSDLVYVLRPPFQWSPRCYSSLGFVLFFFFLTGSWKARDCQTTWYTAGPIGAELGPEEKTHFTFFFSSCIFQHTTMTPGIRFRKEVQVDQAGLPSQRENQEF